MTHAAFNLVHKIDLEHTQTKLAQYEALNKSFIAQQQQQREQESIRQQQLDEASRQERMLRAQKVKEEQELEQREREAEEKAIVAELEKGRSIDDVMQEHEKRRQDRLAASKKRAMEERQRQKLFEERLHEAPVSARPKMNAAELEYIHQVIQSDYVGPFATLDDGSGLVAVREAPVSLGGIAASGSAGYVDPWLKPEFVTPIASAQNRAGGYDWQHQVWQRGILAVCDGLSLAPDLG